MLIGGLLTEYADHGCTPEQAVHVFRSIWYYTAGEILVRAHSEGRRPAGEGRPAFFAGVDLSPPWATGRRGGPLTPVPIIDTSMHPCPVRWAYA
ncbi:hypothetical protein ACWEPN_36855 [Nonomuraea wenchangensis]